MLSLATTAARRGISSIATIGVVGAGQMGGGIAHVAALNAERRVLLLDTSVERITGATDLMKKLLDKNVAKGKVDAAAAAAALARVVPTTDMAAFAEADFVVEAATEAIDLKLDIFRKLDEVARPGTILASNTSSISITKIAGVTKRPHDVIGMHFMNPVPVMKLVEVIKGLETSQATLDTTLALAEAMGKTCSTAADYPGFIANRILMPYINEAFVCLQEGIGSPEDIDKTMKLGTNVPMGPLVLADFIGLDTCLAIMRVLHSQLGDSKYRPAPLLVNYVEANRLGRKVGKGVYEY